MRALAVRLNAVAHCMPAEQTGVGSRASRFRLASAAACVCIVAVVSVVWLYRQDRADDTLAATLWMQTSLEHEVLCREIYGLAAIRLSQALRDPSWTAAIEQAGDFHDLPPAVILDVDETVLDNSPFEARLIRDGRPFDYQAWLKWAEEARADAVPGAAEFIARARSLGVAVFFVTNRGAESERATVKNLRATVDATANADSVLCRGERPDWGYDKASRRRRIAATHRILLLIGDSYGDFASLAQTSPAGRAAEAATQRESWGQRWIQLPNPMYGAWRDAVTGYERFLPPLVRHRLEAAALSTKRAFDAPPAQ